jgi:hypothetical protein
MLRDYQVTDQLQALEDRARRMAEFCATVRERGGRAEVEENEDLPMLRAMLIIVARAVARAAARARSK